MKQAQSRLPRSRMALVISVLLASFSLSTHGQGRQPGRERPVEHSTAYRTIQIDGLSIFYREAGPKDAPTLLLLHGYPSSSRMFDALMPLLADRYHLIAPDYPGFGQSDAPSADSFVYSFDHLGEIVVKFTDALGLSQYALY